MKKRLRLILTALSLAILVFLGIKFFNPTLPPPSVLAQQPTFVRQITVIGQGTVSAAPDIAQANLGVQVTAPTVVEATRQSNATMAAVIAKLKAAGIADKDIQTSNYSIFPQRNTGGPNNSSEITGYQVINTVMVTIRNLNQVGQVLDQAIQAGANNISNITFGFSNPARLQLQALNQAMADAQARADELAKSSGVQRGEVLSMSEVISSGPVPRPGLLTAQAASAAVPIQPGSSEVQVQVQVVYAIQ